MTEGNVTLVVSKFSEASHGKGIRFCVAVRLKHLLILVFHLME